MGRRRTTAAAGAVLAVAVGSGGWALAAAANGSRAGAGIPPAGISTGTADVLRTDIGERQQVSGTLGYAGSYQVLAAGGGTLTRLPPIGDVVRRGRTAYEVDGRPVPLFYGARPVWRAFGLGMLDGTDVRQLEANLRALGYGANLTVDKHFSVATGWAVRRWQKATHRSVTGAVPLGQVVFAPAAVRIAGHDLTVGAPLQPGTVVEHGTGAAPAVTVQVVPADLPTVRVGQRVLVTLPDSSTRPGRIASVAAVAQPAAAGSGSGGGGSGDGGNAVATVPIVITVTKKVHGFVDQASVQVAITQQAHKGVLAVPVTALRAVPGGQYQVKVVTGAGIRSVPVRTGLFDEITGLAEVRGPGLAEGQKVQVPSEGS